MTTDAFPLSPLTTDELNYRVDRDLERLGIAMLTVIRRHRDDPDAIARFIETGWHYDVTGREIADRYDFHMDARRARFIPRMGDVEPDSSTPPPAQSGRSEP